MEVHSWKSQAVLSFSFAFLFCFTTCFSASWEMGFRRRFVESDVAAKTTWSTSSIGAVASVRCQRQRAAAEGSASVTLETVVVGRVQPNEARNVRESRTPDDDAITNPTHIEKLEKAMEILGEESPQAQGLIATLEHVRDRAVVLPIGVRLDSCQAFVERARRRVTAAEEEVTKARRT